MSTKETFTLKGENLLKEIMEQIAKGDITRVTITDKPGKELMTFPMSKAEEAVLLTPVLTAVGALGELVGECHLIIERKQQEPEATYANPMDLLQQQVPEVARAFDTLVGAIVASKGLDKKTKQLIYIALKACEGDRIALGFHVPMARQLGASRAEVADAIILTLTVCGLKGVTTCLPDAMAFFDTHEAGRQA